ncbi:hypothetical protein DUNSADRAFT_15905 [Dunaliella salina]|uniref:Encoded protein n=1 Tax=Dunaliella salina TaxID=3046 RepID=A0ABQ7H1G7_DUNSA|nr:hypothetical protein DUNSADRAFT_15905 [Dunaliella salina]|eukprot:KAF5840662.1 hypothetical protein DUNSADRAFT_15905 [Dunaliella salina]
MHISAWKAQPVCPIITTSPAAYTPQNASTPTPTHSLGLGATYVPHHKAVGFAAAIDERLKKRLESGSKRKAAQSLEDGDADATIQGQGNGPCASSTTEGRKNSRHQGQQHRGSTLGQSTSAAGFAESSEDDEDDDEKGKAAMVPRGVLGTVASG